jgi:hypothetical protein
MKKFPKKLKLSGYDWKLIYTQNKKKPSGGEFSYLTKTIKVNDRNGEGFAMLLHEIVEAVLVDNFVRFTGCEGSQEYNFVFNHTQFAKIINDIYQVLNDNKLLK